MGKQFTITKKIAKHGNQVIIIIPTYLQSMIKAGSLAKIQIDLIEDSTKNPKNEEETGE